MAINPEVEREKRRFARGCGWTAVLVVAGVVLGGWLVVRAVSAAVCADYNSFSNDFCDKWHYDTPPEDALPRLAGWDIEWQELSCGSGGCPDRMYVLSRSKDAGGVDNYLEQLRGVGWEVYNDSHSEVLTYRKGNVELGISDARTSYLKRLYPNRLRQNGFVVVSVSLIDD